MEKSFIDMKKISKMTLDEKKDLLKDINKLINEMYEHLEKQQKAIENANEIQKKGKRLGVSDDNSMMRTIDIIYEITQVDKKMIESLKNAKIELEDLIQAKEEN